MNSKKRGQVTIFIIIGIVLLIAVGLFFVFRQIGLGEPVLTIPEEIAPVKGFVEQCMIDTLTDAVTLAGIQGGYIEIPTDLAESPFGHLTVVGPIMTPMWYHSGNLRIPEMFEIEEGLDKYVEENLDVCIRNFSDLTVDVTIVNPAEAVTAVNKEDVTLKLTMPVEIHEGKETYEWQEYTIKLDVKLLKAYEIAKQVLENENRDMFLETITVDLMALDPDFPLTDFRFDKCHRLTWSKRALNARLKDTLYYNMPRLRVNRTNYDRFERDEDYQKNHFLVNAVNQREGNVVVGFRYDKDWPLFMNVRPSDGDTLKANSGKGFAKYMSFLCMNVYHFTYDIEYPIEVIIQEQSSFDGQGYTFRFGTPVILKQNEGNREFLGEPNLLVPEYDTDFCERVTEESYSIKTLDPVTNEELKANISFECLVFKCDLGVSELTDDDIEVALNTQIPNSCTGGNLIVNPQYDEYFNIGYIESFYHIDLDDISTSTPIEVPLKTYKKIEVEVKKFDKDDLSLGAELAADEEVLIQIENESEGFFEFYTLPAQEGKDTINLMLSEEMTYTINVMLTRNDEYVGGYNTELTLAYADVADSENIMIPVITDENIGTDDQIVELITFIEGQVQLKPELS